MTKNVLMQYQDLKKEIKEVREKINLLEKEISKLESNKVSDVVNGGYGGSQHFRIDGVPSPEYSNKKSLLYSRMTTLSLLEMDLLQKTNEVEEFIANLDDSRMRRIINLRCLRNKSWVAVAHSIGSGCTGDSVRVEFERFMRKK